MFQTIFLALGVITAVPSEGTENYKVDVASSTVEWVGEQITKDHTGVVNLQEGNLEISDGKLTGGSFVMDMTSITNTDLSGEWKEKLEGHLKSEDFFGVDKYPTASFDITKVKGKGQTYTVTGNFTVKGKTVELTFPVTLKNEGDNIVASAEFSFDRSKHDVRYGSDNFFDDLGDKAIYNDVPLKVKLVATK
ncbi:MAG: YceI family protein [Cyclobacteriaceae bacterium]